MNLAVLINKLFPSKSAVPLVILEIFNPFSSTNFFSFQDAFVKLRAEILLFNFGTINWTRHKNCSSNRRNCLLQNTLKRKVIAAFK